MKEKDLLQFLIFIAEEDAQISTIVNFFINKLGYDVTALKSIVKYGIDKNILIVVESGNSNKECNVMKVDGIESIDWSTSNNINEIYYCDFNYYRKKLFVSHPQVPTEFKQFIN
jgi:hypothetical protein